MKKHTFGIVLFLFVLSAPNIFAQKVKVLVFGDSQKIVNEAPASYTSAMDKILTDSQTKDANFIMHMGDIVEDNLVSNWQVAQTAWQKLDGKIPYVLNVGNNDIAGDGGILKYNEYFPLSRYQAWPSFVGNYDRNSNVAHRFNAAGVNWMVISLKIAPSASILAWAESIIVGNPTNKIFIISHDANPTSNVTKLALKYSNVLMVLCGHTETVEPVALTGPQGNKLIYLKTCFHNKVLDMYACILELDVEAGTISGRYYSPQYEKFWDDTTAPYYGDSKMPTKLLWSFPGFNFKNSDDLCPNDPNKVAPGLCGCGVPEGTCTDTNFPRDSIVLQAENAVFSGPLIATNQPGYNGSGFLDFTNNSNDYVTWTANVLSSADYVLSFRYALTANRPMKLTINGDVRIPSIAFPITGAWDIWGKYRTTQALQAGNNTITLTTIGSNGGNFDELGISGVQVVSGIENRNAMSKSVNILLKNNGNLMVNLMGYEQAGEVHLKLTNIMGQNVFQKSIINPTQLSISTSAFIKNAIYIISVEDNNSKVQTKIMTL
ncbi:MAG: hypothetical protein GZ091_05585 [Paludibacter sp.]|nr:hypothetical protein [Paludibacter sp.]